jgi:hypothetical protein
MAEIRRRAERFMKEKEEKSMRDYRNMVNELAKSGGAYSNLTTTRKRNHQSSISQINQSMS